VFTVQPGVSYTGAPWASQTVQVQSVTTNFGQLRLNVDNQTIVYTGTTSKYFRITYTCGGNQNEVSVVRPTLTMQAILQGVTKSFQTVNNIESAGASVTNIVQVNPNDEFIFLIRGLENYTFATVDTTYYQITFETVGSTALTLFDQSSVSPTLYSTVTGLGTAGYISSLSSFSSLNVSISSLATTWLRGNQAYISSLTVDSLQLGSNSAFFDMGDVIANSLSTIQINVGTVYGTSNQTSFISVQTLYASSIIGVTLGTTFIYSNLVSTANLANLVSTANLANLVSTANLANLVSTANLANLVSTANLANLVSTANLANLVSTANLANLVSTANLANLVSTANLVNLISTTFLNTTITSTVIGLGQIYLSTQISSFLTISTGSLIGNNVTINQASTGFVTLSSLNLIDQTTQALGNVYENNSFLYFNKLIFAGARVGPGQFLFPQ